MACNPICSYHTKQDYRMICYSSSAFLLAANRLAVPSLVSEVVRYKSIRLPGSTLATVLQQGPIGGGIIPVERRKKKPEVAND